MSGSSTSLSIFQPLTSLVAAALEIYELEIKIGENTGAQDLAMVAQLQGGHNNRERTEPLHIQGWPWPSEARNTYILGTSKKFGKIQRLILRCGSQSFSQMLFVEEVRWITKH